MTDDIYRQLLIGFQNLENYILNYNAKEHQGNLISLLNDVRYNYDKTVPLCKSTRIGVPCIKKGCLLRHQIQLNMKQKQCKHGNTCQFHNYFNSCEYLHGNNGINLNNLQDIQLKTNNLFNNNWNNALNNQFNQTFQPNLLNNLGNLNNNDIFLMKNNETLIKHRIEMVLMEA